MPTYQPNIPIGSVPFDQDYLNLQGNFQQLNIAYGVDHVPFSNTSGTPPGGQSGLHQVIHMLANSTLAGNPPNNYPIVPPTAVGLTGELFTSQSNDGYNPDEILWYQSGGGRLSQLTSNITPLVSGNGYTYLPGGIIYQWGSFNATSITTFAVTFPIAFAKNLFNLQVTIQQNSNSTIRNSIANSPAPSKTGFTWTGTNSSDLIKVYWVAIGN